MEVLGVTEVLTREELAQRFRPSRPAPEAQVAPREEQVDGSSGSGTEEGRSPGRILTVFSIARMMRRQGTWWHDQKSQVLKGHVTATFSVLVDGCLEDLVYVSATCP